MKFLIILLALFLAIPASAGSWSPSSIARGGSSTFTWNNPDSGVQPVLDTRACSSVSFSSSFSGSPSVNMYGVATSETLVASGELMASFLTPSLMRGPEIPLGPYFIRPDVLTAASGGTISVWCGL